MDSLLSLIVLLTLLAVPVQVVEVYDGDSITVAGSRVLLGDEGQLTVLESPVKVRVCCMDTPELGWRAKCDEERTAAIAAKAFIESRVLDKRILLHVDGIEKFGRVLARVELEDGTMLDDVMIEEGLARPYSGAARENWCP